MADSQRPERTLGLILAIVAVAVFFGIIPMLPSLLLGFIALGGRPIRPDNSAFWLPAIFGVLTLIASIGAWIGRPPATRQAFLTAATLSLGVDLVVNSRPTLIVGPYGSSLDDAIRVAGLCLDGIQIVVFVFALWYVNRAPSRAFYQRSTNTR